MHTIKKGVSLHYKKQFKDKYKAGLLHTLGVFGHVRQPPTQKAVYGALHARRDTLRQLDHLRYY